MSWWQRSRGARDEFARTIGRVPIPGAGMLGRALGDPGGFVADDRNTQVSGSKASAARAWQAKREALRQRGLSEYGDLVGTYKEQEERARQMMADRERLALSTIGQMGAQSLGGLGGMRGGGAAATMAGTGEMATREAMRQRLAGEALLSQRQIGSRQAALERTAFEREAGSLEQEFSQAVNEGDADIQQAIDDSQGVLWDDRDGMARKIRGIIDRVRNVSPEAAAELERKYFTNGQLNRNATGAGGVFGLSGSMFGG